MNDNSFLIPIDRISAVKERLNKIIRRAEKKGLNELSYSIGEEVHLRSYSVSFCDPFDPERTSKTISVECREVTLSVPVLKLAGWSFVGRMEHLLDDEGKVFNLVYSVPGKEIPDEYRTRSQYCDHCNVNRYRKDTFLVEHESGEVKQVGSTCLSDFLGIDASRFLAWASLLQSFSTALSDGEFDDYCDERRPRQAITYPLSMILKLAAASYLHEGYVSRRDADILLKMSTSERVREYIYLSRKGKWADCQHLIPPAPNKSWADKGLKLAEETENWLREDLASAEFEELDDYLSNLATIGKIGYCPERGMGILVSAVYSYSRKIERELQNGNYKNSSHVGSLKQRLLLTGLKVIGLHPFSGMYGSGVIYKFADENNNVFVWFASTKSQDLDVGKIVDIVGTVKKHDTDKYLNCAMTVLNRVESDPERVKKAAKRIK